MINKKFLVICLFVFVGLGCSEQKQGEAKAEPVAIEQGDPLINGRWYKQSQVNLGKDLFQESCSQCHGSSGQSVFGWNKKLADGSFPPPPLNGSAHSWHHPLALLFRTVSEGGIARGGKMPAFEAVLNNDETLAVIAYFQTFWGDEIYQAWIQRGGLN